MRKIKLLSTVAVAALLAAGAATAQTSMDQQKGKDSSSQMMQHRAGSADAGAMDRAAESKGKAQNERSTTGQSVGNSGSAKANSSELSSPSKSAERSDSSREKNPSLKKGDKSNSTSSSAASEKGSKQQSRGNTRSTSGQSTDSSNRTAPQNTSGTRPTPSNSAASSETGTSQAQGVHLSAQQQTKVRDAVFSHGNAPRVDHVDFAVSVGTAVPSHVHLVAVPDTLVQIYPEWRNDEYFVVRDEIVIVDHSRKIAAVIPAGPGHASTGSSTAVVDLSPAEIREVQTVLIERGLLHGHADGIWSERTREALIAFQRREGLNASGRIDSRTVSSLGLSGKIKARGGSETVGTGRQNGRGMQPSTSGQSTVGRDAPNKSLSSGPSKSSSQTSTSKKNSSTTGAAPKDQNGSRDSSPDKADKSNSKSGEDLSGSKPDTSGSPLSASGQKNDQQKSGSK
jgi:Protein of unknown function (DUF1236)/Putative peptidoglycan binding domain